MSPFELWLLLGAAVASYGLLRPAAPLEGDAPAEARTRLRWLVLTCVGLACLRWWLATLRPWGNPDESGYMAMARYASSTNQSLFDILTNLRAHAVLCHLGDRIIVDGIASLVVAATALLLALSVRAGGGSECAALVTPLLFFLGAAPFEGLTSNSEQFSNLGLAIYLWSRIKSPSARCRPARLSLLAGLGLGLAAVNKEQALCFVLVEPLLGLWRWRAERLPWRPLLASQALAAAGFVLPLAAYLLMVASRGRALEFSTGLLAWGAAGGDPHGGGSASGWHPVLYGQALLRGLGPLAKNPLGLLAFASLPGALKPKSAEERASRRLRSVCWVYLLVGLGTISLGKRWFLHYFLLLMPALAPLSAVAGAELTRSIRSARARWPWSALILLFAGLLTVVTANNLWGRPSISHGQGMTRQGWAAAQEVAEVIRQASGPEDRLFVAGWRPELYVLADRPPSSRAISGGIFGMDQILVDLEATPPRVVVFPLGREVPLLRTVLDPALDRIREVGAVYALQEDRRLLSWLDDHGYRVLAPDVAGYMVLIAPREPDQRAGD